MNPNEKGQNACACEVPPLERASREYRRAYEALKRAQNVRSFAFTIHENAQKEEQQCEAAFWVAQKAVLEAARA